MPVEFVCADCEVHVYLFAVPATPDPPLCGTCAFLRRISDPMAREAARARLFGPKGTYCVRVAS